MRTCGTESILDPVPVRRIARAGPVPIDIVYPGVSKRDVSLRRHWSEMDHRTEVCPCVPPCPSSRLDWFSCGLMWHSPHVWEEVVLAFPEQAYISLLNGMQAKGLTDQQILARWQRRGSGPNAPVIVNVLGPAGNGIEVAFDVGYVLVQRTGISGDFFEEWRKTGTAPSLAEVKGHAKRERSSKPRVSKGCGPCHRRSSKES